MINKNQFTLLNHAGPRQLYLNGLKLCAILLLGLSLSGLQAQEALSAAGGNAFGNGGSVSYTVGQMTYLTVTGTNGSVEQGVQHAYEIIEVTGMDEINGINFICTTYPNPTTGLLILKVEEEEHSDLHYQLFDMNGQLLENKEISSNTTSIDLSDLIPSTYILKVSDNKKEVKTFKIIKIK